MVRRLPIVLAFVPALLSADGVRHFDVAASFVPSKKPGAAAQVAVYFQALDPDLRLNVTPAPRLRLDLAQGVLIDKQPAGRDAAPNPAVAGDPLAEKYHDLALPLSFPVAIAPKAAKGEHRVDARVVFFYCSQREAWCRRGEASVSIPVVVR